MVCTHGPSSVTTTRKANNLHPVDITLHNNIWRLRTEPPNSHSTRQEWNYSLEQCNTFDFLRAISARTQSTICQYSTRVSTKVQARQDLGKHFTTFTNDVAMASKPILRSERTI